MKKQPLQSFRLKNFKAVKDSGTIKFSPLTVFIGNNGSGKSSVVEGLETLQAIVVDGLDKAMNQWRGFEHIWHKGVIHKLRNRPDERPQLSNPMGFQFSGYAMEEGWAEYKAYASQMEVTLGAGGNELFLSQETLTYPKSEQWERDAFGRVQLLSLPEKRSEPIPSFFRIENKDGDSIFRIHLWDTLIHWQFVSLSPEKMGHPVPQKRTGGSIRLNKDGSNIAEYLMSIRKIDLSAFEGIFETLQYVLPYAKELHPSLTSELERTVYLQLSEGGFKVPGWLLSTGTLRIVSLLALLRHPSPPPLIVIEEIENGLDPRTIHLIVEEIRNAIESGKTQVIATTHSPYLLDLLHLSQIVVVERKDGEPKFWRPMDDASLREWAKKYGPGKLYTMDLLHQKEKPKP